MCNSHTGSALIVYSNLRSLNSYLHARLHGLRVVVGDGGLQLRHLALHLVLRG